MTWNVHFGSQTVKECFHLDSVDNEALPLFLDCTKHTCVSNQCLPDILYIQWLDILYDKGISNGFTCYTTTGYPVVGYIVC